MKKLLLIVLFICIKQVNAQSVFAPIGTYWDYGSADGNIGTKTLQYYCDTTINNYTCKKIKEWWYFLSGGPTPPDSGNYIEYIYESNDSGFQYFPNGTHKFQLLYSFTQNLHDTIYFSLPNPSYKLVLDSITHTTLCGTLRRVLYYTKIPTYCGTPNNDSIRVIEGLSYVNDYLFSQISSCYVVDGRMNFECLNAQGCIYTRSGSGCSPLYNISQFTNNNTVKIYPNPTQNIFTIEINASDKQTLAVFDVTGKQILSQIIVGTTNIDASNLSAGVYNLSITGNAGAINKRLVIIK